MGKLTDRRWQAFCIGNIFEVSTGANIPSANMTSGNIPRISATDLDNGIKEFTTKNEHKNYRTNENCVSISFLGSAFYHPYKASFDMKIHSLNIKGHTLNKYIGLFIVAECKRQFKKFTYGNQVSSTDLSEQTIMLPIDESGAPDWAFMEDYMREIEHRQLEPLTNELRNRLNTNTLLGGVKLKITHAGKRLL